MRKTKIVCTIGPACDSIEKIEKMMLAGMNVARLNFSHGTYDEHRERIRKICSLRKKLDLPVSIMLDTKGPEYRIGMIKGGKTFLKDGDPFVFTTDEVEGSAARVSVSYKGLAKELCPGDTILVNNGLLAFRVQSICGSEIQCIVTSGGEISSRKSMSFPEKILKQKYLSEKDKEDLLFGIENGVDFIACSFVSRRQDLLDVKHFLEKHKGQNISLIAKIENQPGVDNIEEICRECEGIMIGRGDMGVEIPYEELPAIQKALITKCRMLGKRVITATEMLESMINNPRPTRAEISDVANAVYDGTSAVMLSGETAMGKYPSLTVEVMSRICMETEKNIDYKKLFYSTDFEIRNSMDAISHSACALSMDLNARAIAVCSISGMTARMVSRFRPTVDIIGICTTESARRKLSLSWGVTPIVSENVPSMEVLFYNAKKIVKKAMGLKKGDKIIITGGSSAGQPGNTNTIRIEEI